MAGTNKRQKNQVEEGGEVKEQQSKKRKNKHTTGQSRGDEEATSEEDVGHLESQRFIEATRSLKIQKAAAKNNRFIDNFENMVADSQPYARILCQKKVQELQGMYTALDQAFVSAIRDTIQHDEDKENRYSDSSESAFTPLAVFRKAASLSSSAKHLLQVYAELTERVSCTADFGRMSSGYNEGSRKLASLIVDQGERIEKHVQLRLDDAAKTPGNRLDGSASLRRGNVAWALLTGQTEKTTSRAADQMPIEADWRLLAGGVKKGLKRLIKHLPDEEH